MPFNSKALTKRQGPESPHETGAYSRTRSMAFFIEVTLQVASRDQELSARAGVY